MTSRASEATTLQALELTNGQTLAGVLKRAALRMVEIPPRTDVLIEGLYRKGLGRSPTAQEQGLAEDLVGPSPQGEGVEDLLWAMVMLPEFQLVY